MKTAFYLSILFLILWSCKNTSGDVNNDFTHNIDQENIFYQVNDRMLLYQGTYIATFFHKDYNNISMEIILGDILNGDNSYMLKTKLNNSSSNIQKVLPVKEQGIYKCVDPSGSIIELVGLDNFPNRFLVINNAIIQMENGKVITDEKGNSLFVFKKQ